MPRLHTSLPLLFMVLLQGLPPVGSSAASPPAVTGTKASPPAVRNVPPAPPPLPASLSTRGRAADSGEGCLGERVEEGGEIIKPAATPTAMADVGTAIVASN